MRTSTPLTTDLAAARTLGTALRRVGYNEEAVSELLGEDAFGSGPEDVPVLERRLPDTRLGIAVRLCFLEQPVSVEDAERALGRPAVDALAATGLASVGEDVEPLSRISAVGALFVASDRLTSDSDSDPEDYVATYSPTTQRCDALTPRPQFDRALDVGTGNGVHALLAARHSRQVVATDVNPRALAYTQINAALNDFDNIECRNGSLYEPVSGETFDLIVCNAPFVVSPEDRFTYRDGGMHGDELSAHVIAGAAEHLAEGGFATLLASWIGTNDDDPDERAIAWAEATGLHAWVLSAEMRTPVDHAAEWNATLVGDDGAYGAALDDWSGYLDELGAVWVTEGAVLLHRRDGTSPTVRVDDLDGDVLDSAGAQIERAFAARARLGALERPADLNDAALVLAGLVTVVTDIRPRRDEPTVTAVRVELDEGMRQVVDAPPAAAEFVLALDGSATLGETVRALPASDRHRALVLARDLLELGALRFAG